MSLEDMWMFSLVHVFWILYIELDFMCGGMGHSLAL